MSTVTEGYTIVCFVYGWTDNYRCTYLPKGVVKKYRPSKGKHSNPLRNIYKIVWAFLFLFFFFSATCAWYIRDGWHCGVSALLGSDGLCRRVPAMPQRDIKVAWVQGQVGFPTVLEKGLALISLL